MNEFDQHKKSDSIKWIITFVAIILLVASVVALGTQVFCNDVNANNVEIKNQKPESNTENEPIDIVEPAEPIEPIEETRDTGTLKIMNGEFMKLAAKAPAAYAYNNSNSFELIATAYPSDAVTGSFIWTAEWVNETGFAVGKDVYDYIKLEVIDNSCFVSALQAFAGQIEISVTTEKNPNAVAYCIADYGQKYSSEQTINAKNNIFFFNDSMTNGNVSYVKPIKSASTEEYVEMYASETILTFSGLKEDVYTLKAKNEEYSYTVTVSEDFYNILLEAGLTVDEYQEYTFDSLTVADIINSLGMGNIMPKTASDEIDYALLNAFNQAIADFGDTDIAFTITVNAISEYDEAYFVYHFCFDAGLIESAVEYVEINIGNIIL